MTRKKIGLGLLETFSEPCDVCAGRGVVVHHDPVAKHRTSSTSNQGRRSRGSSSQQQSSQQSAPAQQTPTGGGTHSITEGAKSALAVIAASTIVPATGENPTDAADVPAVPAPAEAERPKKSRRKRGGERKGPRSEAEQLLDSVL